MGGSWRPWALSHRVLCLVRHIEDGNLASGRFFFFGSPKSTKSAFNARQTTPTECKTPEKMFSGKLIRSRRLRHLPVVNALKEQIAQVQAAQRGDPRAQQALFEAWLPTVLRWCIRLGGARVDPEDAAQETLILAFRRLDTLREPAAFDAWLFGTTRRVLANHRRRVWWRRWSPEASVERHDQRRGPEQAAADLQLARTVQEILDRLPARQREVVVLCYLEERSTSEAAHLLGVSQGTIKSRLRLARERFAAHARRLGLHPDPPSLMVVSS